MHPCRPILVLALSLFGVGCAYISDEHAAWREDPDADGADWTVDCDESNPNAGAPQDWYADADADGFGDPESSKVACTKPEGFVSNADDCNDLDPRVHPGKRDKCNAVDDDCDGELDEDANTLVFYADTDGDGYGDASDWLRVCAQPEGFVEDATDCDDSRADVFPDNSEICDERDNDCDGEIDEDVEDPPVWYVDADGDGFGDPDNTSLTCERPDGFVSNGDDCDDTTTAWQDIGPEEIYYNGQEDNCDPSDGDGDADGDGYWHEDYIGMLEAAGLTPLPIPEAAVGDCNDEDPSINPGAIEFPDSTIDVNCDGVVNPDIDGDGFDSVLAGGDDCDDLDADVFPGGVEVCETLYDDDCDGDDNDPDALGCLNYYVDADGDGYGVSTDFMCLCRPDETYTAVLADDCNDGDADISPGGAEVCFDGIDSDCDGADSGAECGAEDMATANLYGESDGDAAGVGLGVTSGGDLIVGAPDYDNASLTDAGAVYILPSDDPTSLILGVSGIRIIGSEADARIGTEVLGLEDGRVAISGPGAGDGGIVYLIDPTTSGEVGFGTGGLATTYVSSLGTDIAFGQSLTLGNLASDDRTLLVIGAPGPDRSEVWIVDPSLSGEIDRSRATSTITSPDSYSMGTSVAAADLNGSGIDDLIIGSPGYEGFGSSSDLGALFIVEGPISGVHPDVTDLVTTTIWGQSSWDRLGSAVAAPGDIDGDGQTDLVVGVEKAGITEADDPDDPGALYIFNDAGEEWPDSRTAEPYAVLWGGFADDRVGETLVASDVDGDGILDLWISAPQADDPSDDAGSVTLVFGPFGPGNYEISDLAALVLKGDEASTHFGRGLSSVGDLDSDGTDDVLIGAPNASGGSGHVMLLLGTDVAL